MRRMRNPDIIEAGIATRFAEGNTAGKGRLGYGKPGSLLYAVRRMNRQDPYDILAIKGDMKKFKKLLGREPEVVELAALTLFLKAIHGNMHAVEIITRLVDGPVPKAKKTRILSSKDYQHFEGIENMSDEELSREIKELSAKLGFSR